MTHAISGISLRTLSAADVPAALELSGAAGWNQTARDWRMLLELAPETCFGIETEGVLTATASLVIYGEDLAWLGMVLTRAAYQRRGYARLLVEHAISEADRLGVSTIKLDATEQGAHLYRTLGFREEQGIERWTRFGLSTCAAERATPAIGLSQMQALDRQVCGVDRSRLLALLVCTSSVVSAQDGFSMHRPGKRAEYLGPCVAGSAAVAEKLIRRCLSQHAGPWFWDILPANTAAVALGNELGFRPDRRLIRMVRGAGLRCETHSIFAIAGFEVG